MPKRKRQQAFTQASSRRNPGKVTSSSLLAKNPFEVRQNAKSKSTIIGRIKGSDRNMATARANQVSARQDTLLKEYKRRTGANHANEFKDARFTGDMGGGGGGGGAGVSEEDAALLRFQKLRTKQIRKESKFNLRDEDSETLTHGGMALADDLKNAFGPADADDPDQAGLNKEMVEQLHFGGGAAEARGGGTLEERRKSRREVMDEIIAKSKAYKAERQADKRTQEDVTDKLDAEFDDLQALLEMRPQKGAADAPPRPKLDAFDISTRTLGFEARARASDRTKSAEEEAEEEKAALEELERKRVARMKGEDGFFRDEGEEGGAGGGRGKGKKRGATTDDDLDGMNYKLDGDDGDSEDADDSSEAELASDSDEEEQESDLEEESEEEECVDEKGNPRRRRRVKPDADMASDSDDDRPEDPRRRKVYHQAGPGLGNSDGEEEEEMETRGDDGGNDAAAAEAADRALDEGAENSDADEEALVTRDAAAAAAEIPFIFRCPATLAQFVALLKRHSHSAADEQTIVDRICTCNSARLGPVNRTRMGTFVAVLLKRLRQVARRAPTAQNRTRADNLGVTIFKLAGELSQPAAAAFRAHLGELNSRTALSSGAPSAWPHSGDLAQLRLAASVFPATDYKHEVLTPAALLLGRLLLHAPVRNGGGPDGFGAHVRDLAAALLSCAALFQLVSEARRFAPEVLAFLGAFFAHVAPGGGPPADGAADVFVVRSAGRLGAACAPQLAWVREFGGKWKAPKKAAAKAKAKGAAALPKISLAWCASDGGDAAPDDAGEAAVALLGGALHLALHVATAYNAEPFDALPEALAPLTTALGALSEGFAPRSPELGALLARTLAKLRKTTAKVIGARKPLRLQVSAPVPIRSMAPRFEENYDHRRDLDPDKERAEIKKLKRELTRERRGAAKELRKDATFLAREQMKEQEERDAERKGELHANRVWLDQQDAGFNQMVRQGHALMEGGGRVEMSGGGSMKSTGKQRKKTIIR